MAELSGHWTTTAGGTGHQQTSYTQAQLSTAYRVLAGCGNYEGVAPRLGGLLACAANGANTVSVATGGAVVDGKWYYNDASLNVNIPSAVGAGNTRIDRIVLRANWAGYKVAVTRIAGTDAASPVAPAITQTSGTTYDIMLCRVLVTTAGTVTVTDERARALPYYHREGGSATNWMLAGTTNYTHLVNVTMQMGVATVGFNNSPTSDEVTVTFPVAFTNAPVIFLGGCASTDGISTSPVFGSFRSPTATNFVMAGHARDDTSITTTIPWLAIGYQ